MAPVTRTRSGRQHVLKSATPNSTAPTGPIAPDTEGILALLHLRSRGAYLVGYGFLGAGCLLTIMSIAEGMAWLPAVAPLVLLAVGGAILLGVGGDPLPWWATAVVAAVPTAQVIVVMPVLPKGHAEPLQLAVAFGGGAILCAFLCLRGRVWPGWVGQCGVFVALTARTMHAGEGLAPAIGQLLSSAGLMVTATFFGWLARPAVDAMYRLRAAQTAQLAARAAADAARAEQAVQKARLDELARPMLTKIADEGELSGADVEHARLLEARLRDSIRARSLDVAPVTRSVWEARSRGVDVVLLDDSGRDPAGVDPMSADAAAMTELYTNVIGHLDHAVDGRITVRVQPPHRAVFATITSITSDGERTSEIARRW